MSVPSFILLCFAATGVLCYFHNRRAQLRLEVEPETSPFAGRPGPRVCIVLPGTVTRS